MRTLFWLSLASLSAIIASVITPSPSRGKILSRLKAISILMRRDGGKENKEFLDGILSIEERAADPAIPLELFRLALKGVAHFVRFHVLPYRNRTEGALQRVQNYTIILRSWLRSNESAVSAISAREMGYFLTELNQNIALLRDLSGEFTSYLFSCTTYWERCTTTMQQLTKIVSVVYNGVAEERRMLDIPRNKVDDSCMRIERVVHGLLKALDPYIRQYEVRADL